MVEVSVNRYAAAVTDPTQRQPVDPWAGSAPVVPPGTTVEPYVIMVDRPRKRRWPWVVGGLAAVMLLCCGIGAAVWAPIAKEYPAHLQLGQSAAGYERVTSPEIELASAKLVEQMF